MHPCRTIQPGQHLHAFEALEAAIADQSPYDGAVLLFYPRLIVLSVGPRARDFQPLCAAPRHHTLVHEHAVIVEIDSAHWEREQLPRPPNRIDNQRAVSSKNRQTFGPTGGDVGEYERLDEASGESGTAVCDEVDLYVSRRRIVPVTEGPDRHSPTNRRALSGRTSPTLGCGHSNGGQEPINGRGTDRHQLRQQRSVVLKLAMSQQRRQQHRDHCLQPRRANPFRDLPQDAKGLAYCGAVPNATSPRLWRGERRRQQTDRVLAMVAGNGYELVEDGTPFRHRAGPIPHPDRLHQFPACCHAHSPRHVLVLRLDNPTGRTLREANTFAST